MGSEFDATLRNNTWDLGLPSEATNLFGNKWIFRIKFLPNGSIDKYKVRFMAKGFHQRSCIDFHETYSPVIKAPTIRLVLGLAVEHDSQLKQLDINNAFLQGTLTEDVYMAHPYGFVDKDCPHYVCKLKKALYGLKQAPRAWYTELKIISSALDLKTLWRMHLSSSSTIMVHISLFSFMLMILWSLAALHRRLRTSLPCYLKAYHSRISATYPTFLAWRYYSHPLVFTCLNENTLWTCFIDLTCTTPNQCLRRCVFPLHSPSMMVTSWQRVWLTHIGW